MDSTRQHPVAHAGDAEGSAEFAPLRPTPRPEPDEDAATAVPDRQPAAAPQLAERDELGRVARRRVEAPRPRRATSPPSA